MGFEVFFCTNSSFWAKFFFSLFSWILLRNAQNCAFNILIRVQSKPKRNKQKRREKWRKEVKYWLCVVLTSNSGSWVTVNTIGWPPHSKCARKVQEKLFKLQWKNENLELQFVKISPVNSRMDTVVAMLILWIDSHPGKGYSRVLDKKIPSV